jgi:hypothetical protein
MTRRTIVLLLSQLLLACDGREGDADPGTSGAGSSTTGATPESSSTSTGTQDDDSGTGGSPSTTSSGPGCTPLPWFPDVDGDGFGPDEGVVMTCDPPPDHVPNGGDCDDEDPAVNISVDEVCDQADNDCDGRVDEPAETNPTCGGCSLFEADSNGYAVCPTAMPWSEAAAHCETGFGGTLVVIDTADENAAVIGLATAKLTSIWIGLSDLRTEGTFVWADGAPVRFTSWNTGEPNDAAGNEDCAHLSSATGVWNDLDCAIPLPYICEVAL